MGSALTWRKSARSSNNGGNCVEMARVPGGRLIATRDSKNPSGPHLEFDRSAWCRLVEDIKADRYDLTQSPSHQAVRVQLSDGMRLESFAPWDLVYRYLFPGWWIIPVYTSFMGWVGLALVAQRIPQALRQANRFMRYVERHW